MLVAGIDPGNVNSAVVIYSDLAKSVVEHMYCPNHDVLVITKNPTLISSIDAWVIEQVASYGMAVGETVFETVYWSGRFAQALISAGARVDRIKRHSIKMALCKNSRAKDANIRQSLIDRLGQPGTKKNPGPTFGMSGDKWAALAVAVAWHDINITKIA